MQTTTKVQESQLPYQDLISQMTLEEKASLMSGANFWNTKAIPRLAVPGMTLTDGPHGLRKQGGKADHLGLNKSLPATCFPTAATLANSWDVELLREVGQYLGAEAAAENVSVLLGPGLNIKRNPLGGRNFEYFSEDPYLSGKLAAAFIGGVQSQGVAACPKHFAVNSQETHRMSVDEIVDRRAFYEIYLEGFRIAITEGAAQTLMSSYNKINGTYANENQELLDEILRGKWNFDGLVVTDWGGNNDRVSGLKGGNALEMPSTNGMTDQEIVDAVQTGILNESILDQRVNELLTVVFSVIPALGKIAPFTAEQAHQKSIEVASQCLVLLENRGILPLAPRRAGKVAVIGDFAKTPRYQGAGSSLVNPTQLSTALEELENSPLEIVGFAPGYRRMGGESRHRRQAAIELAQQADTVLLFLGLDEAAETEGMDRPHMRLAENQLDLVDDMLLIGKPVVVVLAGGSPVELPFAAEVDALVHGYLPGQGGGKALVDVLLGTVNPSGKLAESYPLTYENVPSSLYYVKAEATAEHRESIFVGYRYYDSQERVAPGVELLRYPFGYGMSYSNFEYANLQADSTRIQIDVTNTSDREGAEVIQVYVEPVSSRVFRAKQELEGFGKVFLRPGETKTVSIDLGEHAFSYFHVGQDRWVVEPGEYLLKVGASSKDIRAVNKIKVDGVAIDQPYLPGDLPTYHWLGGQKSASAESKTENPDLTARHNSIDFRSISAEEFSRLVGSELPSPDWESNKVLGYNDIVFQAQGRGGFGGALVGTVLLAKKMLLVMGMPFAANALYFVLDLPFRSAARMSGGKVNMEMLDGLMLMVNGHFTKGVSHFVREGIKKTWKTRKK